MVFFSKRLAVIKFSQENKFCCLVLGQIEGSNAKSFLKRN